MGIDEDGCSHEEKGELSFEQAEEERERYQRMFPDTDYYIEPYEYSKPEPNKHFNENAVDGWEDIFPDRDY